ncbi:twin-arginine translocation signal domain-containing protein [Haladaptatus halobius]|uniref:twin-arginine translocation signal domain-containing protein n=1 Tax=Haladaptatus halobius TaxID=2884875 RepID=UPI001D0A9AC7|nr:extracellular solute-binding protein [Haladaptatus halobius]
MRDNLTRRNFMKFAGSASAGAALAGGAEGANAALSLSQNQGGLQNGQRPVQWASTAYAARDGQANKFQEMTDIPINRTIGDLPTTQQRILSGGNRTFDAVSVDTSSAGALTMDNDVTAATPTNQLDKWDSENISDLFTSPRERLSEQIGAQAQTLSQQLWMNPGNQQQLRFPPTIYNFDAIGYNPNAIEPGSVSRWSALFADEYQGQVLFDAIAAIGIPEALMHLMDNNMVQGDVGQLNDPTRDQLDQAIDFLVKEKRSGQFRSTWTAYGNSVNLMASEEAIIGDIWQPAALDVRRSGTPCKYATMSEGVQGYRFWYAGIIPIKPGAQQRNNVDEVNTLINDVHYGAWFPGYIQGWGYSVPQYPNTELVRTGSDESGQGMGPEYYDWAYRGERTYEPVEDPNLFDPQSYNWSMQEGNPSQNGQQRDSGPIEERINRIGFFQIWPSNADYMIQRWRDFESA